MEQKEQGPILIVIEQLVEAFLEAYDPCYDEWHADETFTMSKLRQFFNAFAPTPGNVDPIKEYLDMLTANGFTMQVTCDGLPAIFVNRRKKGT